MTSNHETTTNNEHDSKTDEFVVVEGDGSPATTRLLPTEPTTPPSSQAQVTLGGCHQLAPAARST